MTDPRGIETLEGVTTWDGETAFIVQVFCPTCGGDRLEPENIGYTCCRCGQYFVTGGE